MEWSTIIGMLLIAVLFAVGTYPLLTGNIRGTSKSQVTAEQANQIADQIISDYIKSADLPFLGNNKIQALKASIVSNLTKN